MAVVLLGWCAAAEAQPARTKSASSLSRSGNGLTLTREPDWPYGPGYWPFRLTITPTPRGTADRMLSLELVRRRAEEGDLRVLQDIEIPPQSGPVVATISVPQLLPGDTYALNVWEDGNQLQSLSISRMSAMFGSITWDDDAPAILIVGKSPADVSAVQEAFPSTSARLRSRVLSVPAWPLADLPERWIDYTNLDILCLSLDELTELHEKRPAAFRAVLDWTRAGGNLWVYGTGRDWRRLGQLGALAGLADGPPLAGDPEKRGWREPDPARYRTDDVFPVSPPPAVLDSEQLLDAFSKQLQNAREKARAEDTKGPPFLHRPLGMGLVVALAADDPFPGSVGQWRWLFDTMGEDRWNWSHRHGLSPGGDNPDFWNFLIPGVGLAPVTEFCVLITLFVVGIGPVNYWLLRRRGKLHLLVLTVPASAAAVTLLLFAYAWLADGFSVRVRARSVTVLDQRQGHAACWARLSYYAGLAPRGGLLFPTDMIVLPLEHAPSDGRRQWAPAREMVWDDQQRLTSGWLPARTPTQFITVRSQASDRGLDILPATGGKGLTVRNRLGTRIQQLLVRAEDGAHYWCSGVSADEGAALEQLDATEGMRRLQKIQSENQLAPPPGMDQPGEDLFGFRRRRRVRNNLGIGGWSSGGYPAAASQHTGRLESAINLFHLPLAPRSYVAVVESSPEVVYGVAAPREEKGFHVIYGRW